MAKKKQSQRGSTHANKHPYLRQELWANGSIAFYLKNEPGSLIGHDYSKYREFHERMILEAQRANRL